MRFNIIGAGRLGKNLALTLVEHQIGHLIAICNSSIQSAELAVQQIGAGTAIGELHALPAVDLTFITTPDDLIYQVAQQLAEEKIVTPGSVVVHCSGSLSSEVLNLLKEQGCFVASVHPPKAFRHGLLDSQLFTNCICIVEGDTEALDLLSHTFKPLKTLLVPIDANKKTLYHAATVFSSNYLVTLASVATELFTETGIPSAIAQEIYLRLMHSSLTNLEQTNLPAKALTGPLVRGDYQTITKHLAALQDSKFNELYRAAALVTLSLTNLDDEKKLILHQLLEKTA
ncbi:Uncharacterized conserved protein [Legionella hackeliae]|uniref:DUF2520 domain-containing protein n=2 Tax=Legionella hackeliae TaxID=449 RepID=A0A0A8UTM3_LEGHA|nr:DUF2520 domain-containing protein [Legionella hackeliae]KTD12776.1 Rossmann-like domain protein [Legionella hackeliae]CEK12200.1 conserved protein of unknown function [Legionella hackeliae]STX48985.1 Uncharacterized conserved protein [Legionella hackeliae]